VDEGSHSLGVIDNVADFLGVGLSGFLARSRVRASICVGDRAYVNVGLWWAAVRR